LIPRLFNLVFMLASAILAKARIQYGWIKQAWFCKSILDSCLHRNDDHVLPTIVPPAKPRKPGCAGG